MDIQSLQQFRDEYLRIRQYSTDTNDLRQNLVAHLDVRRRKLPAFPSGHTIRRIINQEFLRRELAFVYNGYRYSDAQGLPMDTRMEEIYIDPIQCIGDAWLFNDDRSEGKPDPEALADLLLKSPDEIPAPVLRKAGKYYLCTDGAHRVYAAYLMERPLKVSCDYEYCEINAV